jgi:hypothetical protein
MLGLGEYTVMAADRGGVTRLGQLTGLSSLRFNRVRDGTSECSMVLTGPDEECCGLLADLRTARNEVVVYRNGARVWEGPITRLGYRPGVVEVDARDISWYVSRRILEREVDQVGRPVEAGALLYDLLLAHYPRAGDPWGFNVGPWVTRVLGEDEARTAARIKAYSRTLFDVLDQYAHSGGIDYTVTGRRLVLWDTQTQVSVLPTITSDMIDGTVNVTEYGQELRTRSYVTTSEDTYSSAIAAQQWMDYYGPIDFVDTNVDEGGGSPTPPDAPAMEEIATRLLNVGHPAPTRVWIGEDSRLDPCYPVEFSQLQAGAFVVLESVETCRRVSQWQKVQEVSVVWTPAGESVSISLVRAPAYWTKRTGVVG